MPRFPFIWIEAWLRRQRQYAMTWQGRSRGEETTATRSWAHVATARPAAERAFTFVDLPCNGGVTGIETQNAWRQRPIWILGCEPGIGWLAQPPSGLGGCHHTLREPPRIFADR